MSEDFEKIDLTLPESDYALVVFHNTPETYQAEASIECRYTITQALEPSTRDWVGIYKVGWRSARQYVCFDWSRIPDGYSKGQKADQSITFNASSLPKDDGEFYQFCYVTSDGHVRGASTPFQFRAPGATEYVEVEDDEDEDILVIKTKTMALEDELTGAVRARNDIQQKVKSLQEQVDYLEKERETLLEKLIPLDKALQEERDDKEMCKLELQKVSEQMSDMKAEIRELSILHSTLKEKVSVLNKEKAAALKQVQAKDEYIQSLQVKIKSLINEKDALTGSNKALEEEKELFKNHFTSSEGQVKGYLVEIEELRMRLRNEEKDAANLKTTIDELKLELDSEKTKVENQATVTECDKVHITDLAEKLKNCEDKLAATEQRKLILIEEVETLKQTFDKLSADLEEAKSEAHTYKSQLSKQKEITASFGEDISKLTKTLQEKQQELSVKEEEYSKLRVMQEEQTNLEKKEEEGSLFALNVAYHNLSQRFERTKASKEELVKNLDETLAKLRSVEKEKCELADSYRERLRLGQEEYQRRVVECRHLQRELKRALRNGRKSQSQETVIEVLPLKTESQDKQDVEEDIKQGNSASDSASNHAESDTTTGELTEVLTETPSLVELTASELQLQMTELGEELETRQRKKLKYKALYQEEKEKRTYMQQHYFSELRKKDEEVVRLKQVLQDSKDQFTQRISTLEGMIEQQKVEITELNRRRIPPPAMPMYPPQSIPNPYPMPPFLHHPPPPPSFYPPQMPNHPIMTPQPMCGYSRPPMVIPAAPMGPPFVTNPGPPNLQISLPTNVPPVPPRGLPNPPIPQRPSPPPTPPSPDPLIDGETPSNLDPPLQPLPPPLSPQRSVEALVAEVKAINTEGSASPTLSPLPPRVKDTHIDIDGAEEDEDERFHDAEEGPAADLDSSDFDIANPGPARPPIPSNVWVPTGGSSDAAWQPAAGFVWQPAADTNGSAWCSAFVPPAASDMDDGDVEMSLRTCPVCEMVFPPHVLEKELFRHVEAHMDKSCPVCGQLFEEASPNEEYVTHVQGHFTDDQ